MIAIDNTSKVISVLNVNFHIEENCSFFVNVAPNWPEKHLQTSSKYFLRGPSEIYIAIKRKAKHISFYSSAKSNFVLDCTEV